MYPLDDVLSVIFGDSGDMVRSPGGFHFSAVGGVDLFTHLTSISEVRPIIGHCFHQRALCHAVASLKRVGG